MIRRPSGVTATPFNAGFILGPLPDWPWAPGIVSRSRPSAMRQMKSVASCLVPATRRVASGVNARQPTPSRSAMAGVSAWAHRARPARRLAAS